MALLARLYARRIINVNVNILTSGVLAGVIVLGVVKIATAHLGVTDKKLIGVITFLADVGLDVAIYYGLHWTANHSLLFRRFRDLHIDSPPAFFRDATNVQVERMVLSPLLYTIWLGLQYFLMHEGVGPVTATAIGLVVALVVTRVLHTAWMIKQERKEKRMLAAAAAAATAGPAPEPARKVG